MGSYKGPLSLVFAALIYGLYGVFSRMIGIEFGIFTQSTIRNLIGSLIMPLEVVFGVLFGYIFYREVLSFSAILGGILIILASIIPNIKIHSKPSATL